MEQRESVLPKALHRHDCFRARDKPCAVQGKSFDGKHAEQQALVLALTLENGQFACSTDIHMQSAKFIRLKISSCQASGFKRAAFCS